jgi:hypothetical protein
MPLNSYPYILQYTIPLHACMGADLLFYPPLSCGVQSGRSVQSGVSELVLQRARAACVEDVVEINLDDPDLQSEKKEDEEESSTTDSNDENDEEESEEEMEATLLTRTLCQAFPELPNLLHL